MSAEAKWYILRLPKGFDDGYKRLKAVQKRYASEPSVVFEYFAPIYTEVEPRGNKMVATKRPLYLNYVFVKADLKLLEELKSNDNELYMYKFLPRVETSTERYYPYVTEVQMKYMKWVADSYVNRIPVYVPQSGQPMKGDRVRITKGDFKGLEATVAIQPGRGQRTLFVSIDKFSYVPLTNISEGDYEIIEYNSDSKHLYTRMYNDSLSDKLHQALQRYHKGTLTEADKALAEKVMCEYGSLDLRKSLLNKDCKTEDSKQKLVSCRIYAYILPASTILKAFETEDANNEAQIRWEHIVGEILGVISNLKEAWQALALLYVTLYGCTDNIRYYEEAHKLVDPWRHEGAERKIKQQLISRLDDYDTWLEH